MDRESKRTHFHSATSLRFSPLKIQEWALFSWCLNHGEHHVLPHQNVRRSFLPPDRREPMGGGTTQTTRHRHSRTTRSTPAERTTRRPPGLGRPPGSVRLAPLGPRQ